jgi:hypothetical protein
MVLGVNSLSAVILAWITVNVALNLSAVFLPYVIFCRGLY